MLFREAAPKIRWSRGYVDTQSQAPLVCHLSLQIQQPRWIHLYGWLPKHCSVYSLQNTLKTEYKAHTMSNCRLSTLQTGLNKLIKIQKRLKERLLLPSSQEYSLEDA